MEKAFVYIVFGLAFVFWAALTEPKNMENIHGNLGLLLVVMGIAEALTLVHK